VEIHNTNQKNENERFEFYKRYHEIDSSGETFSEFRQGMAFSINRSVRHRRIDPKMPVSSIRPVQMLVNKLYLPNGIELARNFEMQPCKDRHKIIKKTK